MQELSVYHYRIFKLVSTWDKYMNVLGDFADKLRHFSGICELHLTLGDFSFDVDNLGNITYYIYTYICYTFHGSKV